MTNLVRYLTHPQVKIDPVIPVPSWGLSEVGRARTEAIASTGRLSGTTQIISSGERKAIEAVANQFFARPHISIRGWERAIDAQLRIVREVEHVLARNRPGDVLFIGHGGVGTLLYCHYFGFAIDRTCDQPAGGGYFFAFTEKGRRVQHSWRRIEDL